MPRMRLAITLLVGVLAARGLAAQGLDSTRRARECPSCAEWNAPHAPFRVFGNTWYVGTAGLSAILVTGKDGHVLIDGGLPESAPLIAASIRAAGFDPKDVKLIVNSHAHYDHAGGIAELQRLSGARVVASEASAAEIASGRATRDDPQYALALPYPAAKEVATLHDGDTLRVGDVALVAHLTGGHTPGGTTWSWRSCEGSRCANLVYADSFTPVSDEDFLFTRNATYPRVLDDFERSFALLDTLPCDLLLTPHPGASRLWERLARRDAGNASALLAPGQCAAYAATGRAAVAARVAREKGGR
ncbi:MAG TPA: subclass B3 metallo-beta-lactamase [Gemmatimonadaceae bacterium]